MPSSASPCFLNRTYSKTSFLRYFGKVRNNKLMRQWFRISPLNTAAKIEKIFYYANFSKEKAL